MPKICYVPKRFRPAGLEMIRIAETICTEYVDQGITITLRQLYYQFVSRGYIANKDTEYKRLGEIVNDARLAGLIDWNHLLDRTRNLVSLGHWGQPKDIMQSAADTFRLDRWDRQYQQYRPEVWIEKDAAIGVVEGICNELDVPYFSCRGYNSQSEMWAAAQRLQGYTDAGQTPYIFHFGDHDPSGMDMSRDIADRLALFGTRLEFTRVALNMDQVLEHNPPPNPAKISDARAAGYISHFGDESWELDALNPTIMSDLIRQVITAIRDAGGWQAAAAEERKHRRLLLAAANRWSSLVEYLETST